MPVSTGGATYKVDVKKPVCLLSKNIATTDLDPTKAADRPCFEGGDTDKLFDKDGLPVAVATACKDQQWDVSATLSDPSSSGAQVTMLQGVAVRVAAKVQCP